MGATFDIEAFLHAEIPLARALGIRVCAVGDGALVLTAPLAGNHNDKHTAFAGSLYSVAALCAWGWVTRGLHAAGCPAPVAVYAAEIRYTAPVTADFAARCAGVAGPEWNAALAAVRAGRRAKLTLAVAIESGGRACAHFNGRYAVLPDAAPIAGAVH